MLIQRGGRILSILGVCSFLAARFYCCHLTFYYVWAEPRLAVLLSKIMGGRGGDAMIFAGESSICPGFQLARAPEGRCQQACLYSRVLPAVLISKMTETFV